MRVLRLGVNGDDVRRWQNFLLGQSLYQGEADGFFGPATRQATIDFQRRHSLHSDGTVGDKTYGTAMQLGYSVVSDPMNIEPTGINWPPPPDFGPLVTHAQKEQAFGVMHYAPAPTPTNREAIRITNDWDRQNMTLVDTPALGRHLGTHRVYFHRAAAYQLQMLFDAWEREGLIHHVLSWGGSYVPRFVRGSTTYLSNHAYGTAFDINMAWNGLGVRPALVGEKGSVRELVPLANDWGFYWGGHFGGRLDGMHFEVARLISP